MMYTLFNIIELLFQAAVSGVEQHGRSLFCPGSGKDEVCGIGKIEISLNGEADYVTACRTNFRLFILHTVFAANLFPYRLQPSQTLKLRKRYLPNFNFGRGFNFLINVLTALQLPLRRKFIWPKYPGTFKEAIGTDFFKIKNDPGKLNGRYIEVFSVSAYFLQHAFESTVCFSPHFFLT